MEPTEQPFRRRSRWADLFSLIIAVAIGGVAAILLPDLARTAVIAVAVCLVAFCTAVLATCVKSWRQFDRVLLHGSVVRVMKGTACTGEFDLAEDTQSVQFSKGDHRLRIDLVRGDDSFILATWLFRDQDLLLNRLLGLLDAIEHDQKGAGVQGESRGSVETDQ